jgi:hypothetical protein
MRCLASGFLSELVIALVDDATVFIIRMPDLGTVPAATLSTLHLGGENADAAVALQSEIEVTVEMTQSIVAENARVAQNQEDYNKRYNALVERYDKLKAEYDETCTLIFDNDARNEQMGRFITVLKEQDGVLTEFDEGLWSSLVENLVVKSKTDVMVVFKDGTEIKAE